MLFFREILFVHPPSSAASKGMTRTSTNSTPASSKMQDLLESTRPNKAYQNDGQTQKLHTHSRCHQSSIAVTATMSSWRNVMELGGPASSRRYIRRTIATATTASTLPSHVVQYTNKICPCYKSKSISYPTFEEAAQFVPFQFTSSLATYVVRRSYGNTTVPDLFAPLSLTPDDVYRKRAHVTDLIGIGSRRDNCQGPVAIVRRFGPPPFGSCNLHRRTIQ
jgi:hypothetical protein